LREFRIQNEKYTSLRKRKNFLQCVERINKRRRKREKQKGTIKIQWKK